MLEGELGRFSSSRDGNYEYIEVAGKRLDFVFVPPVLDDFFRDSVGKSVSLSFAVRGQKYTLCALKDSSGNIERARQISHKFWIMNCIKYSFILIIFYFIALFFMSLICGFPVAFILAKLGASEKVIGFGVGMAGFVSTTALSYWILFLAPFSDRVITNNFNQARLNLG